MTADPLWIAESDVVALMHLGEAVTALERGLAEEAAGRARNMDKTTQHWGAASNMHAIGAIYEGAGIFGAKSWGHTEHGSTPLLTLWDAGNGRLLAIIEAFALGQMRTGAMSGVGTRCMAAPEAAELAVIGTGKQATTQVAAVIAVRPIRLRGPAARQPSRGRDRRDRERRRGGQGCADRHPGHARTPPCGPCRDAGARHACQRRGRDHARAARVR
jgi:ornithine cyclodeaminase/alanine dehydrogenase-like protein (mu-crystallin family)